MSTRAPSAPLPRPPWRDRRAAAEAASVPPDVSTVKGSRKGKRRREVEAPEQEMVVRELLRAKILFNAQSNGLPLSKRAAVAAVKAGLVAGCPDLLIFDPPPNHPGRVGCALEMKTEALRPKTDRAGRWSGAKVHQKIWLDDLDARGWLCFVGYGAQDAIEKLASAGYPVKVPRWARKTEA